MLTKYEFKLLFEIFKHKGQTTYKEQSLFKNEISFYRAIRNLKSFGFIIISDNKADDNRIMIYEITLKGIQLCKLLNG